ncbi:MAG: M20/M25/M40 family metallo-hydrolase [Cyanobacteria bacterium]|nr:M20/M25/M40 family metallo-hydrolase [Cyanobacteriota bacterium]
MQTERLLETFLAMVQIDSPSGDEGAMAAYLIAWAKRLGLDWHQDATGNVVVNVPGCESTHSDCLVLSGHMDVVPPCSGVKPVVTGSGSDRVIHSDNTTVLGADDKAGLAVILEAVETALEEKLARPALRLLFTVEEETSMAGARGLSDADLDAQFAITFDHTGRQGVIIHQAPSYRKLRIQVPGISVHAGIAPEKGINAITLAARMIHQLPWGRLDADTTANVGTVHGGKATNIVPDAVVIEAELRSHNIQRLDSLQSQVLETVRDVIQEAFTGRDLLENPIEITEIFTAYSIEPSHPALHLLEKAMRVVGVEPQRIRSNGGSDNNIFFHRGLPGVVLTAGYQEPHSLKEKVALAELETAVKMTCQVFREFSQSPFGA